MSSPAFWRSALVQAALVAAVFGLLLALPLPDDFFEDYGWVTGPVAWLVCALATGRILRLPLDLTLFAAAAGGIAGAVGVLAGPHWFALVAAIGVFGASCAGYEGARGGPGAPLDDARPRDSSPA